MQFGLLYEMQRPFEGTSVDWNSLYKETLAQCALAFILAPALALVLTVLLIVAALGFGPMLARARSLGDYVADANLSLLDTTTQFLGGLKLAAAQNSQANFLAEFQDSLASLKFEQLAYIRLQNRNRLAVTIIAGFVGALIAFVGLVVFDMQAAVILTMLLIFARISGPAMQMSQMLQQFVTMLPAYAEFLRLERDLAVPKLHADQLSDLGGATLAAEFDALSADHLEYLDEAGAKAMASAGTVAVLLPGAYYALEEKKKPPVALLRKHKVPIAVATDCNPGTSPLLSPTLAMNMACTLFGLTPDEALQGMTTNAARALGLAHSVGSIAVGKQADLCVWRIESLAELGYWVGLPGPERRIFNGADSE